MALITIPAAQAQKIKVRNTITKKSKTLLVMIAGASLYDNEPSGCHVTYELHSDKSLKRVFLSDEEGKILSWSNDLTCKIGVVVPRI